MFLLKFGVLSLFLAVCVNSEATTTPKSIPNLMIKSYSMCKGLENTPVKVKSSIEKINASVFSISGEGSSPYDVGDNVMVHIIVQLFENSQWSNILNMDEKDPCKLLNDYIGEQWHAMEKQIGIPVGECPIPKGSYAIKDYHFDVNDVMAIENIPRGRVRIQANATQGEELILCLEGEFESK